MFFFLLCVSAFQGLPRSIFLLPLESAWGHCIAPFRIAGLCLHAQRAAPAGPPTTASEPGRYVIVFSLAWFLNIFFLQFSFNHSRSTTLNTHQNCLRPGLCPGPRWETLRRSPRPSSRLGRGTPSPYFYPLNTRCTVKTKCITKYSSICNTKPSCCWNSRSYCLRRIITSTTILAHVRSNINKWSRDQGKISKILGWEFEELGWVYGVENCKIVFLGGHFLFTCTDFTFSV